MRYYRHDGEDGPRLLVSAMESDEAVDLTSANRELTRFRDLARMAGAADASVDEFTSELFEDAVRVPLDTDLDVPVLAEEVWAAGVTYRISEEAREAESGMPEMYLEVYENDRPEIFFKSTARRTVGPNDRVGIREDSEWDVPEPELGVVLYEGETVGYTVGNDMSSRSIEGENPLYLPQAKVYDRSCSLGPCVVSAAALDDPHDLTMSMSIRRDGDVVFDDVTSTGEMKRSCEELVDYLTRHNSMPEMAVLLTGTSLVPSESFTLAPGDVIDIHIEEIGTLSNTVALV